MPLVSATDVLKVSYKAIVEIHKRLEALSESDEFRQRIERRIKELQTVADELKASGVEDFPASCQECLQRFQDSLGTCQNICDTICSKNALKKFVKVYGHREQLQNLDKELENARNSLQLALTRTIIAQNQELHHRVQEGAERVENTVLHPSAGVYLGTSVTNKLPRPLRIDKPEVSLVDDLMVIKWAYRQTSDLEVDRFEVQYDDEKGVIVPGDPDKLRSLTDDSIFAMSFGAPKVRPGRVYTIRVRAVNRQGHGEWSNPAVKRFGNGPPNKPKEPTLIVMSPTEILVKVQRLKEEEENGSPVEACVVEYVAIDDANASEWQSLRCPIKSRRDSEVKFSIKSLTADTKYNFRVKMINEDDESPPSDAVRVLTTQLTPGQPQDLRVSSKRTDKTIKIRWRPPAANPHVVCKYEAQIQPGNSISSWNHLVAVRAEKLSATALDLDTDTKYNFRVRAVNNKEEAGDFTDPLQAETRYGKGGRIAAATGAFVGGTIGGPLLGATGLGYMAGSAAKKSADSKPGKAAGSIAAGIGGGLGGFLIGTIGAPLLGATAAVYAYKGMAGELGDQSPQSSEDEEEESMFREVWKLSQKKSEDMFKKD